MPSRTDPVTAEVRELVLRRDGGGCVAPVLGAEDECRDRYGRPAIKTLWPLSYWPAALTLDHVKDEPRMGKRAPSDPDHLVTLCWHHHLDGWATSHRPELRRYLAETRPHWEQTGDEAEEPGLE
jgi:hypothetical protein